MPSAVHTAYNIVYTDSIEHCENLIVNMPHLSPSVFVLRQTVFSL